MTTVCMGKGDARLDRFRPPILTEQNAKMRLEQWGALAAIFTFVGAILTGLGHFVQRYWRRIRIERYLLRVRRDNPDADAMRLRRFVGQLAVEMGMTSDQVYDATKSSKRLERGRNNSRDESIWFSAKPDQLK